MKFYTELPQNTPFTLVTLVGKDIRATRFSSKADFLYDCDVITQDNPEGTYLNIKEWVAGFPDLKYIAFVASNTHFDTVCKDLKCRELLEKLFKNTI